MKRLVLSLLLLSVFATLSLADIKIIVNKDTAVSTLTKEEVKRVYTGKMTVWGSGERIALSTLSDDTLLEKFTTTFLGIPPRQFTLLWQRALFSGNAIMPKSFKTSKEAVDYVAGTAGAIGFVDADTVPASVQVVTVTE